jgi:ornithine cyclodeaminase
MIVFLSESDVQATITMSETLTVVESAFRDHALGQATILPRISQTLPGTAGMFRILAAALPTQRMFGLKTLTGAPGKRLEGEVYFVILLFEMGSGALRAVISANYLTGLRTGAASGVAAKYLAREDASSLGIVGAGIQAWFQAEALCAVRPVDKVKIFSRDQNRAIEFAARIHKNLGVKAVAVNSAEDAVRGSDLIIAATSASAPVIQGDWLEPGMHISGIGANTRTKRELDATCFERARVAADSRDQVLHDSGDLRDAVESGKVKPDIVYAELGELAAGLKQGRSSSEEITIFKSVGVALQDVAVGTFLFESAQRAGIGIQLEPHVLGHHLVGAS